MALAVSGSVVPGRMPTVRQLVSTSARYTETVPVETERAPRTQQSSQSTSALEQLLWVPSDEVFLGVVAAAVSLISFVIYWQRGEILLYGDAVAHIGIARRVIDSATPGFAQLGTVWLPLPHLLMLPFVAADFWWRLGV